MIKPIIIKVVKYVPDKIAGINNYAKTIIEMPAKVDRHYTVVSKCFGAGTGATMVGKGTVDVIQAVACGDGVCATISAIGVTADVLQICANFVPGPNVTSVITFPISCFCKSFVWFCKGGKMPWGGC